MDKLITDFIEKQKVASICCLDEERNPYCFSIFYVFDRTERRLYFKSSPSSNHAGYLNLNKNVAGTIVPDRLNMLAIRGIQFTGELIEDHHEALAHATAEYYRRFPYAFAMPGRIWAIQLECVKMTDNTVNFGHKISWEREDLYEDIC